MFIVGFTNFCHLFLAWEKSIHFTSAQRNFQRQILILS